MHKILLINPPIEDYYQTKYRQQPLGLEYIAALLTESGFDAEILDALSEQTKFTVPLPARLSYTKQFYPNHDLSPFKLFTSYQHFGMRFENIQIKIRQSNPRIIGISANFSPYCDMVLKVAQICKKIFPDVPVIAGGHHVTAAPEAALNSGAIDYVILGEGESTFTELANYILEGQSEQIISLKGIAWKKENRIVIHPPEKFIENLDSLPLPIITSTNSQYRMIISSRGCPKKCNFCSIRNVMGKKIRFRSISSVIEEIKVAVHHGAKYIDFEDDNLTCHKPHAMELFQSLCNNFADSRIKFSALNGLDTSTLDFEILSLMKKAGFEWLNIPLVSTSSKVQNQTQRDQSRTKFFEIVQMANKAGLKVIGYHILGLPEDNIEQMLLDICSLAGHQLLIGPSVFYPPPGSLTYQNCINRGYINDQDFILLRSSAVPVETEKFSRKDIMTLFRLVRVINFVKQIIDQNLKSDQNLIEYLKQNELEISKLVFPKKLTPNEIGFILLRELFINGELKGLKLKNKTENQYHYEWLHYHHSPKIVEVFLNLLKNQIISGIVTNHKMHC